MGEENLMCPICGGLHPAGHRDKELEDKLEAVKTHLKDYPDEKDEKYSGSRPDISTGHYIWNMPYFLTDLETWITALRKILEVEG